MKLSAVILAGGHSRRMGRDKAFLEWHERPLLAHQIRTVQRLRPCEIFISGRPGVDYSAFDCRVITDSFSECGPLAGIENALCSARCSLLLVLAVDMPHMTSAFLRRLSGSCSENDGAIPDVEGRLQPTAAFYPKAAHALAADLLRQGLDSATHFAQLCLAARLLHLSPVAGRERRCFSNWNAPSDLIDSKLCASSCLPI